MTATFASVAILERRARSPASSGGSARSRRRGCSRSSRRSPRWRRSGGSPSRRSRTSSRRRTSSCSPASRSVRRPASSSAPSAALSVELLLRPGPVDAVADGGLGPRRAARRRARARRAAGRAGSQLALACAFAGLLYGELLNASLWVNYSDHSLAGAAGLHGPRRALRRRARDRQRRSSASPSGRRSSAALQRFETRMRVRWVPAVAGGWLLALLAVLAGDRCANAADRYLTERPERRRRLRRRARAGVERPLHGLGRARARGGRPPPGRRQAARRQVAAALPARHIGDRERHRRAWRARSSSSGPPGEPARATSSRDPRASASADGAFEGRVNTTAFARPRPGGGRRGGDRRAPSRWLEAPAERRRRLQLRRQGRRSRASTTPARRCRRSSPPVGARRKAVKRAARFLARQQNPDGGFPLSPGGAVQRAVDRVGGPGPRRRRSQSDQGPPERIAHPLAYLRSLTGADGAVRYSRTSAQTPVWVTAPGAGRARPQAVPAALGRSRQPAAARRRPSPTPAAAADADAEDRSRRGTPKPRTGPAGAEPDIDLGPIARSAGALTAVLL